MAVVIVAANIYAKGRLRFSLVGGQRKAKAPNSRRHQFFLVPANPRPVQDPVYHAAEAYSNNIVHLSDWIKTCGGDVKEPVKNTGYPPLYNTHIIAAFHIVYCTLETNKSKEPRQSLLRQVLCDSTVSKCGHNAKRVVYVRNAIPNYIGALYYRQACILERNCDTFARSFMLDQVE